MDISNRSGVASNSREKKKLVYSGYPSEIYLNPVNLDRTPNRVLFNDSVVRSGSLGSSSKLDANTGSFNYSSTNGQVYASTMTKSGAQTERYYPSETYPSVQSSVYNSGQQSSYNAAPVYSTRTTVGGTYQPYTTQLSKRNSGVLMASSAKPASTRTICGINCFDPKPQDEIRRASLARGGSVTSDTVENYGLTKSMESEISSAMSDTADQRLKEEKEMEKSIKKMKKEAEKTEKAYAEQKKKEDEDLRSQMSSLASDLESEEKKQNKSIAKSQKKALKEAEKQQKSIAKQQKKDEEDLRSLLSSQASDLESEEKARMKSIAKSQKAAAKQQKKEEDELRSQLSSQASDLASEEKARNKSIAKSQKAAAKQQKKEDDELRSQLSSLASDLDSEEKARMKSIAKSQKAAATQQKKEEDELRSQLSSLASDMDSEEKANMKSVAQSQKAVAKQQENEQEELRSQMSSLASDMEYDNKKAVTQSQYGMQSTYSATTVNASSPAVRTEGHRYGPKSEFDPNAIARHKGVSAVPHHRSHFVYDTAAGRNAAYARGTQNDLLLEKEKRHQLYEAQRLAEEAERRRRKETRKMEKQGNMNVQPAVRPVDTSLVNDTVYVSNYQPEYQSKGPAQEEILSKASSILSNTTGQDTAQRLEQEANKSLLSKASSLVSEMEKMDKEAAESQRKRLEEDQDNAKWRAEQEKKILKREERNARFNRYVCCNSAANDQVTETLVSRSSNAYPPPVLSPRKTADFLCCSQPSKNAAETIQLSNGMSRSDVGNMSSTTRGLCSLLIPAPIGQYPVSAIPQVEDALVVSGAGSTSDITNKHLEGVSKANVLVHAYACETKNFPQDIRPTQTMERFGFLPLLEFSKEVLEMATVFQSDLPIVTAADSLARSPVWTSRRYQLVGPAGEQDLAISFVKGRDGQIRVHPFMMGQKLLGGTIELHYTFMPREEKLPVMMRDRFAAMMTRAGEPVKEIEGFCMPLAELSARAEACTGLTILAVISRPLCEVLGRSSLLHEVAVYMGLEGGFCDTADVNTASMLENRMNFMSDPAHVSVQCEDEKFSASRVHLMARSKVLDVMLRNKNKASVVITGATPEITKNMLDYIHFDTCEIIRAAKPDVRQGCELMTFANKFKVTSLVHDLALRIGSQLTPGNFEHIYATARKIENPWLQQICEDYSCYINRPLRSDLKSEMVASTVMVQQPEVLQTSVQLEAKQEESDVISVVSSVSSVLRENQLTETIATKESFASDTSDESECQPSETNYGQNVLQGQASLCPPEPAPPTTFSVALDASSRSASDLEKVNTVVVAADDDGSVSVTSASSIVSSSDAEEEVVAEVPVVLAGQASAHNLKEMGVNVGEVTDSRLEAKLALNAALRMNARKNDNGLPANNPNSPAVAIIS